MGWKGWMIILSIIGMAVLFIFLSWLFWVILILFFVSIGYRLYKKWSIPRGHHINHGLLRGYLSETYGDQEGGKLYKRLVRELNRKGYR